jgi:hypothetical protein
MENSGKIFFEDDGPHWYVALGDRWLGPMSAADVYAQILTGKLTWAHFVWKSGQKSWTRICDSPDFKVAVPELPSQDVINEVKKEASSPNVKKTPPPTPRGAAAEGQAEKIWFLYYSDSQYGPFSKEEVERFLHVGRIHRRVHVWMDGMKNWDRIENVPTFQDAVVETGIQAAKAASSEDTGRMQKEQRSSPRAPLVAKIMVAAGQLISVAMCRDISVGGMQVLTDKLPGDVGAKVKLNVSSNQIEPFVAEGVIVRILEDKRGFSFRFDRLPDNAKRAIEAYISSSGV